LLRVYSLMQTEVGAAGPIKVVVDFRSQTGRDCDE
jgi:hypothetical protein